MEQLEIHSKSYLVRWVNVPGNRTLSWNVQPHKKSINLGIFKHPGGNAASIDAPAASTVEAPPTPQIGTEHTSTSKGTSSTRNDASNAAKKLQSLGLILLLWIGRCEAEKVATGNYDVPVDQGGMYAIVFDNTFSKQLSKTVTLVLMTYPTNSPPVISQYPQHLKGRPTAAATASASSVSGRASPGASSIAVDSTDSVHEAGLMFRAYEDLGQRDGANGHQGEGSTATHFTGTLLKRRRKRHQGYARRFFSLDFTSSTLSYYHNKHSSALRGAIPLSLAAIGANAKTREISVDSGAEVWHLRASNPGDFAAWRHALEKASSSAPGESAIAAIQTPAASTQPLLTVNTEDHQDWGRVEALVGRVAGIRDAVGRLECTTKQQLNPIKGRPEQGDASPTEVAGGDYFQAKEKQSLWKRKASGGHVASGLFRRHVSNQLKSPGAGNAPFPVAPSPKMQAGDPEMHGHCVALLKDLDAVVADFTGLIGSRRQRGALRPISAVSQRSIETVSSGEFFDADEGKGSDSQLLNINDSDNEVQGDELYDGADDASSDSELGTPEEFEGQALEDNIQKALLPSKPDSLAPLPTAPIKRRLNIPAAWATPPSLIGFLRKNVGKDLSTISMPVSANEPLSLLQRTSEQLEYSSLLDAAATTRDLGSAERLLYVTAFAISSLSNSRCKERAIRKPFNPLLGETFELVREDRGFRLLAEKVSHRPVRIACQAESFNWTFSQCPMPTQKFWGKSAELITDGKARVVLHPTGDLFSWTTATCFLRNLIAGEKYVEPVGTMTVCNEKTGQKAVVTFKAKGMFSGRSEDVAVRVFGGDGRELSPGLVGKWTSSLSLTQDAVETNQSLWKAGQLVDNPAKHYGFTTFAASLNEITSLESGKLPPTDSRLRPDQRAAEQGDLDRAEALKQQLEETQRARRRQLEQEGDREWVPRWFEKVPSSSPDGVDRDDEDGDDSEEEEQQHEEGDEDDDSPPQNRTHRPRHRSNRAGPPPPTSSSTAAKPDEELWRLKTGKNGYWEERVRGQWTDVVDLFAV